MMLFGFMFLDWFGVEVRETSSLVLFVPIGGGNAWEMLGVIPLALLLLAIVTALGAMLFQLLSSDAKEPTLVNLVVAMFGGVATVLILGEVFSPVGQSESFDGFTVEPTFEAPIFLALIAALGITFGGLLALREAGPRLRS